MTTGSTGGGSAQTLMAVERMAKAVINPQLRNLPMMATGEGSIYNVTSKFWLSCASDHKIMGYELNALIFRFSRYNRSPNSPAGVACAC